MNHSFTPVRYPLALAAALMIGLSGCSDSDDNKTVQINSVTGTKVAIATQAADFSAGRVDLHSLTDGSLLLSYPADKSDLDVASDGAHIFQIGRYEMDHITKFGTDSNAALYQYSVKGDDDAANPSAQI